MFTWPADRLDPGELERGTLHDCAHSVSRCSGVAAATKWRIANGFRPEQQEAARGLEPRPRARRSAVDTNSADDDPMAAAIEGPLTLRRTALPELLEDLFLLRRNTEPRGLSGPAGVPPQAFEPVVGEQPELIH